MNKPRDGRGEHVALQQTDNSQRSRDPDDSEDDPDDIVLTSTNDFSERTGLARRK